MGCSLRGTILSRQLVKLDYAEDSPDLRVLINRQTMQRASIYIEDRKADIRYQAQWNLKCYATLNIRAHIKFDARTLVRLLTYRSNYRARTHRDKYYYRKNYYYIALYCITLQEDVLINIISTLFAIK